MSTAPPVSPRVLVVEDEFLIRLTLVEALGDEGFMVFEAEDADGALSILQSDEPLDLLLTDIQLPGSMDGTRLAERARQRRPALPVLFMSGRPDPVAEGRASPLDRYISKPYTLAEICTAVRTLTGTPATREVGG